jgi:hypothetical protein
VKDDGIGGACRTHRNKLNAYMIWWESQKERDIYEDLDVDGRIISKWFLEKYAGMV